MRKADLTAASVVKVKKSPALLPHSPRRGVWSACASACDHLPSLKVFPPSPVLTYCGRSRPIHFTPPPGSVCHCCALARVSVENPLNSFAWLCDGIDDLFRLDLGFESVFDHCSHNGLRDKATLWWCSDNVFMPLAIRCTRDHQHALWQPVFWDGR